MKSRVGYCREEIEKQDFVFDFSKAFERMSYGKLVNLEVMEF